MTWGRLSVEAMAWLLLDPRDAAGADRPATFPDGEPDALFHGNRLDQLHVHRRVVGGHDHLGPFGERDLAGDVRGAEVELGPVVVEEGRVAPAFVLAQH